MLYANYIKHTITTPDTLHRRFENDLPEEESVAKRVALAMLPFLSLYRPTGAILSLSMGGCRVVTHLSSGDLFQLGVASVALASTIFNYSLGLLATTVIDAMQGGYALFLNPSWEEALQTGTSTLYLAFMATGVLEYMVWFALVQVALCIIQSKGEIAKGHYLEAVAKIVMAAIRIKQADDYCKLVERRNALYAIQKYQGLIARAARGRVVRGLLENPLMETKEGYYHGFGKQLVKGENLTIRKKGDSIELDFKVNHVFRDKIQKSIDEIAKWNNREVREILELSGSHVKDVTLGKGEFYLFESFAKAYTPDFSKAHQINLVGLGSILIGCNKEYPNLYDRVVVKMDKDATLFDFHEMMAFMDLDEALNLSTAEDIERLKLGHLYRIFFPRDAFPLERSEEFFTLPLDQLKTKMFEKTPGMKEVYDQFFHRMVPAEIYPGKVRYRVVGLSEKAYELGARALTAAITGAYTDEGIFRHVASILKKGMLSTEARFDQEMVVEGLSSSADFWMGGADSVYTQMITAKDLNHSFGDFAYDSRVRLLIKLDAIETGTYQYFWDSFGMRKDAGDFYRTRPSILEFVQGKIYSHHEVMLKERLDPSNIQALIVPDQAIADNLRRYLQKEKIDVPENFIRVGTEITSAILS